MSYRNRYHTWGWRRLGWWSGGFRAGGACGAWMGMIRWGSDFSATSYWFNAIFPLILRTEGSKWKYSPTVGWRLGNCSQVRTTENYCQMLRLLFSIHPFILGQFAGRSNRFGPLKRLFFISIVPIWDRILCWTVTMAWSFIAWDKYILENYQNDGWGVLVLSSLRNPS